MPAERELYPWQGRLYVQWHIGCAGCAAEDQFGPADVRATQEQAMRWFRRMGWGTRGGLWFCPRCLNADKEA